MRRCRTAPGESHDISCLPAEIPDRIADAGARAALGHPRGSGWIAEQFIASVRARTRQEIVAVGARSQDKADAFAKKREITTAHGSYEALVADPGLDVICVATPHNMHHEHVVLALGSGKNLLVEKPMALSPPPSATVWDRMANFGVRACANIALSLYSRGARVKNKG